MSHQGRPHGRERQLTEMTDEQALGALGALEQLVLCILLLVLGNLFDHLHGPKTVFRRGLWLGPAGKDKD